MFAVLACFNDCSCIICRLIDLLCSCGFLMLCILAWFWWLYFGLTVGFDFGYFALCFDLCFIAGCVYFVFDFWWMVYGFDFGGMLHCFGYCYSGLVWVVSFSVWFTCVTLCFVGVCCRCFCG